MTEHMLITFFSNFGTVTSCKMTPRIRPTLAYIEFFNHSEARRAILKVNGCELFGITWKVIWAEERGATNAQKDHHVFVGDLCSEVQAEDLREAFSHVGEITTCRVVCDMKTKRSKGYGFIGFVKEDDALAAINTMHGHMLKGRQIRTNWATRDSNNLTLDQVLKEATPTNTTVFCAGIREGLNERLIKKTFAVFGKVQMINILEDKGVAFVKFLDKMAAANAIVTLHKSMYHGQLVRCAWAREDNWAKDAQGRDLASNCANPAPGTSRPVSTGATAHRQILDTWYRSQLGYSYTSGLHFNPGNNQACFVTTSAEPAVTATTTMTETSASVLTLGLDSVADYVRGPPLFFAPGENGRKNPSTLNADQKLANANQYRLF